MDEPGRAPRLEIAAAVALAALARRGDGATLFYVARGAGEEAAMMSRDRLLICSDCGKSFLFAVTEQLHFLARGFADPIRCRNCRRARRLVYEAKTTAVQRPRA